MMQRIVGLSLMVIFASMLFGNDASDVCDRIYLDQGYSYPAVEPHSSRDTVLGDVIYELHLGPIVTPDLQCVGLEFDGTYFYVSSGGSGTNKLYVIDTTGVLVWAMDQPTTSTWGWRDLAWDGIYAGADRIDTLYGSSDDAAASVVHKFGVDLSTGALNVYGTITGPTGVSPVRALAYKPDSGWFFGANWGPPYYKFSKASSDLGSVTGPGSSYGAAYDTDPIEGGTIWWHSQLPAMPWRLEIDQMDANDMSWTGTSFGIVPATFDSAIAGGLCFHEGFRGMDVLFALIQGYPDDGIIGVFVRFHDTDIEEKPEIERPGLFGFASSIQNPIRNHAAITYITPTSGHVRLRVYDGLGRMVRTLVDAVEPAGTKTIYWDAADDLVTSGIYFLKLDAENRTDTEKLILFR